MGRVRVLGSLNVDHVQRVARHPAVGETVPGETLPVTPGGKGLNQAVAAALAGTGQRVVVELHGSVGNDDVGRWLIDVADRHGVSTTRVRTHATLATGAAWIVVAADGANTVIVDPGANQAASWELEDGVLSPADVVVAQLEVPEAAVARVLAAAKAAGARSVFNPSPMGPGRALAAEATIVVVNENELAELSEGASVGPGDIDEVRREAARVRAPDQIVIVTLGAAGALALGPDGVIAVPGIAVRAVDTTGAGDCFLGVLAASIAGGLELAESLHRANRAAAWSVQRHGAVTSMPRAADLDSQSSDAEDELRP